MLFTALIITLGFVATTALPVTPNPDAPTLTPIAYSQPLVPNIITEFPKGTWLENLVIRQADGNAIVTVLSAPEVYLVSTTNDFKPILLAEFPGNLGVLGIVELGHDIFYVAVGNWSASTAVATPGSWSVWELDLTHFGKHGHVSKNKVVDLPDAGFLNGMAVLNPVTGTLLVADSLYSAVWKVDVKTSTANVVINDTAMSTDPTLSLALGINSIKIQNGFLYFDNTDRATFNRIPIDPVTGEATGAVETFIDNKFPTLIVDDFIFDFAGNAWIPSGRGELILQSRHAPDQALVVAGNTSDTSITGFTAAKFGASQKDLEKGSLYVTTCAGAVNYFFSNWTAGGMLLRYDTAGGVLY